MYYETLSIIHFNSSMNILAQRKEDLVSVTQKKSPDMAMGFIRSITDSPLEVNDLTTLWVDTSCSLSPQNMQVCRFPDTFQMQFIFLATNALQNVFIVMNMRIK